MSSDLWIKLLLWLAFVLLFYVFAVTLGVALLTLYCTWAQRNDPKDEAQQKAFAEARAPWVSRLFWLMVEGTAQALAFVLQVLSMLGLLPIPRGSKNCIPVVLLPGFTENSGQMWCLARRLAKRGFNPILVDFPSTLHPVFRNVEFLRQWIEQIRSQYGSQHVAIVAHSMGGVIARALIHSQTEHGISVLVSISSPHRGSHTAGMGLNWPIKIGHRDLVPGSRVYQRFPPSLNGQVPIHSIIGFQEDIVSPAWSCVLFEGETVVLDIPVGHILPLFLHPAFVQIEHWLLEAGVTRRSVKEDALNELKDDQHSDG